MASRKALTLQGLLLALLAVLPYLACLRGPFIWDDRFLMSQLEGQSLSEMLGGSFIERPDGGGGDFFRPLTTLTLALDYALGGGDPLSFHVTNLLLHALAVLSVWILGRRLAGHPAGLLGAAVFALHPTHAEAVCWISSRGDLLAASFVVASVLIYLRWQGSSARFLSLVPATLALLSKETAAILPTLVPLSLWFSGERSSRKMLGAAVLFGTLVAIWFAARVLLLPAAPHITPAENTALQRLALVTYSVFTHLQMLLLPHTARLGYHVVTGEITGTVMLPWLIALIVLGAVVFARRGDWPALTFGALWFAFSILPASQIIPGLTNTVVAQRYIFLASAGPAVLLGVVLTGNAFRPVRLAFAALVLVALGVTVLQRSFLWSDDLVFWKQFVRDVPAIGWSHYHLGVAYLEREDSGRARVSFEVAAGLMPDAALPEYGLGEALMLEERPAEAAEHYGEALERAPGNLLFQSRLQMARRAASAGSEAQ